MQREKIWVLDAIAELLNQLTLKSFLPRECLLCELKHFLTVQATVGYLISAAESILNRYITSKTDRTSPEPLQ